jgi:hypothetical protein
LTSKALDDPRLNQVNIRRSFNWLILKNPFNVPIAEKPSLSLPKSRNSLPPKALPTSPNVALLAVRRENPNVMALTGDPLAIEALARCTPPPVRSAANRRRCPSSLAAINRSIAETVSRNPENNFDAGREKSDLHIFMKGVCHTWPQKYPFAKVKVRIL